MVNLDQAILWASQGADFKLKDSAFVQCTYREKAARFFKPCTKTDEFKRITAFVQEKLERSEGKDTQQYLKLAEALIKRPVERKVAISFDRAIVKYRSDITFAFPENKAFLQKWERNGMPISIFKNHVEFCEFMESSGLMSQMKVTRDTIHEIDGEPAINFEGKLTKWSQLKTKLKYIHSDLHKEKMLVAKQTTQIYTYLDNGRGLQEHDPFHYESNALSVLNDEEYHKLLAKAQEFVRAGEEGLSPEERSKRQAERPFILQLVTFHLNGPDNNFHNLMLKPQHPYVRIIIGRDVQLKQPLQPGGKDKLKKGEVYEYGYCSYSKGVFFGVIKGEFRSPDACNYKQVDRRIVTSIPTTEKEALETLLYTLRYHREGKLMGKPIGYQVRKQNCSTYARYALQAGGINAPSEIMVDEMIARISPDCLRKVGNFFIKIKDGICFGIGKVVSILPRILGNVLEKIANAITRCVKTILEAIAASTLSLIEICLGSGKGEKTRAFVEANAPDTHLEPDTKNWKKWVSLSCYNINLPGVLQEWQRKQASTVIYHNPIKLSIVP